MAKINVEPSSPTTRRFGFAEPRHVGRGAHLASSDLLARVVSLQSGKDDFEVDKNRLHSDLRMPVNAILGFRS